MPEASPVLVEVTRNGFVESVHRGSVVLLAPNGAVELAVGDPDATILPRSSLKPLQATAMLENGFPERGERLALAAASHIGEDLHIDAARAVLAGAGLDESALRCPPALPSEPAPLIAWAGAGGVESRVCHNCSGKHSAMLATCAANGWDLSTYLAPEHPLQQAARRAVEGFTGAPVRHVAVDGCGAPAFGVSLLGLARAFARVMTADIGTAAAQVRDAMRAHPRMIAGTGQLDTELMSGVPGLLCKSGAEGVLAAALPDGRALAAKLDDGAMRARSPLLAEALRHWGCDVPVVRHWARMPVLGGGRPQGTISAASALRHLLGT